ncbi:MAG TPA: efflux RND transporter permease subunit [Aquificae bacterium]|nr:efflux RND transporter permease subunit [Aquificota bacterium]
MVYKFYISTKSSNFSEDEILNSHLSVDGKSLYLKEIATTQIKYEKHSLLTRTDGQNSLMIMTKKAKQGDAIKLSKEIRKILKIYKENHPHLEFKVLNDSSFWIETRLNVISANILIGLILLFFAIWVFISLKIALVVIIGIPVSFAFGIIGIESTASSLNTLSMIGVLLSLGLLVDEAIVVSENIHRHKLMGKTTHDACVDGTAEVVPVLFVAMLTTVIAFYPLTTLTGALGAFIKIIPIMVIILIVSSFIESFVFLPSHYAILNSKEKTNKAGFRDKVWEKIAKAYKRFFKDSINILIIFYTSKII